MNDHGPNRALPQYHLPGRILPLSPEAISQIHSSKHITTLQGVIFSLLENSLDAGANKVSISVDWRRGGCTVEDDGMGIPAFEFREGGGPGKMYCSSKRNPERQTHGQAGTFLAELGNMSLLSITSRCYSLGDESTVTLHHGKVIARQLSADEESATAFAGLHQKRGTSVTVRDLFGNMPVRVKQRALATDMGNDEEKAWQELRRGVVALLLAWHTPCSVKLRDTNTASRMFSLSSESAGALTERALAGRSKKSMKHDIRDAMPVILQAGLAPMESRHRWIPLSASTSTVTLTGMICLDPAPTKECQFIAIGITPCTGKEFHRAVDKLFLNSRFGMVEDLNGGKPQTGLDRHPMYFLKASFQAKATGTIPRDTNMNGATVQNFIRVLEAAVHAWLESNHFRPRKRRRRRRHDEQESPASSSRSAVQYGVSSRQPSSVTPRSLSRTGSRAGCDAGEASSIDSAQRPATIDSRKRQRIVDLSTEQLLARPASIDDWDETGGWHTLSRARSGLSRIIPSRTTTPQQHQPYQSGNAEHCHAATEASSATPARPQTKLYAPPMSAGALNDTATSLCQTDSAVVPSSDEFGAIDDEELFAAVQESEVDNTVGEDNTLTWTDPITKQVFQVNSRTGVVLPILSMTDQAISSDNGPRHRAAIDTAVSSAGRPISLARRSKLASTRPDTANSDKEKWLPGFLKEWKNPIFAKRKEEPIPTASISGPGLIEQLEEDRRCCPEDKYHQAFAKHGAKTGGSGGTKLSRAALKYAEVIGQVDRKFILVKMPSSVDEDGACDEKASTLVLIDQHAASERIILEDLLADMFAVPPASETDCIIKTSSLIHSTTGAKTLTFEVSAREHELFARHISHFLHWGIQYTLPAPAFASSLEGSQHTNHNSNRNQTRHRITITHLPTVVAERASNFPALAIDLLRTEIWVIEDGSRTASMKTATTTTAKSDSGWINHLPLMPTKLLHMIQSRACRSGIMFNDVLKKGDCEALVRGLAGCWFPFVCAHGRCGVVPVMEMGAIGEQVGLAEEKEREMKALRRFMGNDKNSRDAQRQAIVEGDEDEDEDVMMEQSPHKFG